MKWVLAPVLVLVATGTQLSGCGGGDGSGASCAAPYVDDQPAASTAPGAGGPGPLVAPGGELTLHGHVGVPGYQATPTRLLHPFPHFCTEISVQK